MGTIEVGRFLRERYEFQTRHGEFAVLNAIDPKQQVKTLLAAEALGNVTFTELGGVSDDFLQDHHIPGFAVLQISRVDLTEKGKQGTPSPFAGFYIIEENFGMPHPWVIIPSQMVQHKSDGQRDLFPINLPRQSRGRGRI